MIIISCQGTDFHIQGGEKLVNLLEKFYENKF